MKRKRYILSLAFVQVMWELFFALPSRNSFDGIRLICSIESGYYDCAKSFCSSDHAFKWIRKMLMHAMHILVITNILTTFKFNLSLLLYLIFFFSSTAHYIATFPPHSLYLILFFLHLFYPIKSAFFNLFFRNFFLIIWYIWSLVG